MFLIGGQTKDVMPKAMFIRSGDIVVMSEQSRLAYHGVPKILPHSNHGIYGTPVPSCLSEGELIQRIQQMQMTESCVMGAPKLLNAKSSVKTENSIFDFKDIVKFDYQWLQANWRRFEQYLASTRININIRQVYH